MPLNESSSCDVTTIQSSPAATPGAWCGCNVSAERKGKHDGHHLLRPARADQSEQSALFSREFLKRQALKSDGGERGAAVMDDT